MQTNIIWTRNLIFGISILLLTISSIGCSEGETLISQRYGVTYNYQNDSGIDLTLEVYNRFDDLIYVEKILNNTTHTLELGWPTPFVFAENLKRRGSWIQLRWFKDEVCIKAFTRGKRNIFRNENYLEYDEIINPNPEDDEHIYKSYEFTLTYVFKPDDFVEDVRCNVPIGVPIKW